MNAIRATNPIVYYIKVILIAILLAGNIIVGGLTIASAYGGYVDPNQTVKFALLSMMLPGILVAGICIAIIDLLFKRFFVFIQIGVWLICLPSLLIYSPLHLGSTKLSYAERSRSFTLLTYNTMQFKDFRGEVPGLERNATVDYILRMDADIVNLQEAESLKVSEEYLILPEQIDSINARYPHRVDNVNQGLTVLSKYPLEFIDIPIPDTVAVKMALFRLDIKGQTVHLFDVHLESIGLSTEDKELYAELFKKAPANEIALKREVRNVKLQLIDKLSAAFHKRVDQARYIRHVIDSIGGDFIVAGDFNDIQGCYAIRTILGDDMHDAYAENAFGPTITYHDNRFYFRIDHILYGGGLRAVRMKRGDNKSSDHSPMLATFVLGPPDTTEKNK